MISEMTFKDNLAGQRGQRLGLGLFTGKVATEYGHLKVRFHLRGVVLGL